MNRPVTESWSMMTKVLVTYGIGQFTLLAAILFSPHNINHPFWIVTGFCVVNMILRCTSYEFEYHSYSDMKTYFSFGVLKMLTGSLLVAGAILSEGDVVLLGLGIAAIFLVLGGIDVARGAVLLNDALHERQQVRRVRDRQMAAAAQRARENLNQLTQAAEQHKLEDALLTDLSELLMDSDPSDGRNK